MVKAKFRQPNGRLLTFFGLSDGNVERLKRGDAVFFPGEQLGIEGDITIVYGKTELEIAEKFLPQATTGTKQ